MLVELVGSRQVVKLVHVPWSEDAFMVIVSMRMTMPEVPLEAKPRGATQPYVPLQVKVREISVDWETVKRLNMRTPEAA